MNVKNTRRNYALLPLVLFGAVSLASACSDDGGSGGGGSGAAAGEGSGGDGSGATSNNGGSKASAGETSAAGKGGEATGAGGDGGAGGSGVDLCAGLDLECEDDDNPCTEDECNPATGKCGIPRDGASCDDGLFCNGEDTCSDGECSVHEGNPCGKRACDEAEDYCECGSDKDCPSDEPGNWSECMFDAENVCDETGTRTRPVTTYSCDAGKCVSDVEVETDDTCTRDTDGMTCPSDSKLCTGDETCKNGVCTSAGNPCKDASKKYCYESGTMCRECSGGGLDSVGCGGGEVCCSGNCVPEGECVIIVPTIINPTVISPTTIVNPTLINPTLATLSPTKAAGVDF